MGRRGSAAPECTGPHAGRKSAGSCGGVLGGGFPGYGLYRTREGHVALAALEPHFREQLLQELGVKSDDRQDLGWVFQTKAAEHWEEWVADRDLPLAAVRDVEHNEVDETESASQRMRTSTRGEGE